MNAETLSDRNNVAVAFLQGTQDCMRVQVNGSRRLASAREGRFDLDRLRGLGHASDRAAPSRLAPGRLVNLTAQEDHCGVWIDPSQRVEDIEPRPVGEAQVDDRSLRVERRADADRFAAGRRATDGVPAPHERVGEGVAEGVVVIDDEQRDALRVVGALFRGRHAGRQPRSRFGGRGTAA